MDEKHTSITAQLPAPESIAHVPLNKFDAWLDRATGLVAKYIVEPFLGKEGIADE